MLTKAEEIALLDKTIEGLPEGYLKDILSNERAAIVKAIENDVGFTGLDRVVNEAIRAHKRIAELKAAEVVAVGKLTKANTAIYDAHVDLRRLSARLHEIADSK